MGKLHYDGVKTEKTQRWYMDKILSTIYNPCSCSKAPKSYRYGECSSTMTKVSTLQVYGSGKGTPLTDNAEGEEIVSSHMKV